MPGPTLSTRVCPKVCGPSGVLTKPGISGELQDLLILWRKEALKGCRAPAHQPPTPGVDPAVRTRGIQGGWELITHLPGSGALSG